jgi:L,D-peptidoglycan transpeptidase YkuD (ErfK/YbiS/YcfS/YnhG family)
MPARTRHLEHLSTAAEVATAGENASPWWEGSIGRSEMAWARATREANLAMRDHRRQQTAVLERVSGLLGAARDEVARARAQIQETGMGRSEAAAMERARTNLGTAERLIKVNRYHSAAEELTKARSNSNVVHRGWTTLHARFTDPWWRRKWQGWVDETLSSSRETDSAIIIVDKLRRRVYLYRGGRLVTSFAAELGANGLRPKEKAGDRATPEGKYRVTELKKNGQTRYYKALLINYPNDEDRMRFALGQRRGQISQAARIGNMIEIHGDGGAGKDWTDGCVALTNDDMDRLFGFAYEGMAVTIVGTYEQ